MPKKEDGSEDDFIYVGYNFHWENRTIALPNLPEGMTWKKTADTSDTEEGDSFREREESYEKNIEISPRTIVVLTGKRRNKQCIRGFILRPLPDTSFL